MAPGKREIAGKKPRLTANGNGFATEIAENGNGNGGKMFTATANDNGLRLTARTQRTANGNSKGNSNSNSNDFFTTIKDPPQWESTEDTEMNDNSYNKNVWDQGPCR
ncbi:MAG: hypothetical protein HN350_03250 [Phycisphaerales bacterium]|nr:hypothetical protein [Phycisphaerales bacterium]